MDACRDYNYHYSVKSLKFIFFKKIENQNGSIATGPKPTSIIQKKKKKGKFRRDSQKKGSGVKEQFNVRDFTSFVISLCH